jgi:uncharacterized protein (TIGR02271 family)
MISTEQLQQIIGTDVVDSSGSKIGKAGQVYLDDTSGQPSWVTVKTGLFGSGESFAPLDQATFSGDQLQLPYSKDKVKDAPRVSDDGHIAPEQEDELYRYYGLGGGTYESTTTTTTERTDVAGTVGHDTSGPTTDQAMTRSKEELHAGTQKVEAGRARLRKYIVTEQQQVTVPVSREEVRVEREPITDANRDAALSGPDLSEEEHEVILTEERPVIAKETVPVERVRLDTETVTEQQTVTADVRKEVIDADVDGDIDRR